MLSDKGSIVIRRFGILNTNVPPDVTRFYGIPFPGQYLIAPDGTVKEKTFLPDYQERPAASQVLIKDFNTAVGDNFAIIKAGELSAKVRLSDVRSFSGQQLGVTIEFTLAPGWHIYGEPLPPAYTHTEVKFDDDVVASQKIGFPQPALMKFKTLNETLPVFSGTFRASGTLLIKQKLQPGEHKISGTIRFQECSESICKIPQSVRFELPVKIDALVPAAPRNAG